MVSLTTCPDCKIDYVPRNGLKGLCPNCLMREAVDVDTSNQIEPATSGCLFTTPKVAELQDHFEQYEILDLIARGGMSAVYRVRQKSVNRIVALKILPKEIATTMGGAERFARETAILASLNHPNIVSLYDAGQVGPWYYFTMEYVQGPSLRQLLGDDAVSEADVTKLLPDICDGLQYAHNQGVIHRDIKPENILIDEFGRAKVADFGMAKLFHTDHRDQSTNITRVVGTPRYMAPEQSNHKQLLDHRADLYSLGIIIYEMLTGEIPSANCEPPSVARDGQLATGFDGVVLKALSGKPDQRYQSARDLRMDILTAAVDTNPHNKVGIQRSFRWSDILLLIVAVGMFIAAIQIGSDAEREFHQSQRLAFEQAPYSSWISLQRSALQAAFSVFLILGSFILARIQISSLTSWSTATIPQKLMAPILYAGYLMMAGFYLFLPAIIVLTTAAVPLFLNVTDWQPFGIPFSANDREINSTRYWLIAVTFSLMASSIWGIITSIILSRRPSIAETLVTPPNPKTTHYLSIGMAILGILLLLGAMPLLATLLHTE